MTSDLSLLTLEKLKSNVRGYAVLPEVDIRSYGCFVMPLAISINKAKFNKSLPSPFSLLFAAVGAAQSITTTLLAAGLAQATSWYGIRSAVAPNAGVSHEPCGRTLSASP